MKPSIWGKVIFLASAITTLQTHLANAALEQFVESFNGNGRFTTVDGRIQGFDNPDWNLVGTAAFEDGGIRMNANPIPGQEAAFNRLYRELSGNGGFVSKLVVRDASLAVSELPDGATIGLEHLFTVNGSFSNRAAIVIAENDKNEGNNWNAFLRTKGTLETISVPSGRDLELTIRYEPIESMVSFFYDNDFLDDIPPIALGTLNYDGMVSDQQAAGAFAQSTGGANALARFDSWSLSHVGNTVPGDFNDDGTLDIIDIELLTAEIVGGAAAETFDLNNDSSVDQLDRTIWVRDLAKTWFGDANLDGEFNSNDLVVVFQAGDYEDDVEANSTWATGDWNGDAEFNSRDLVLAFQDGGYEVGPRARSVPETSVQPLVALTGLLLLYNRRPNFSNCQRL